MANISNVVINDTTYSIITNTLSDGFYLNLSFYAMWKFGESYSPIDGNYTSDESVLKYSTKRGRYIHYIKKDELTSSFNITLDTLSVDEIALILCEYNSSMEFIKSTELVNGTSFAADENTEYYSLSLKTLGAEKSMSAGQWGKYFEEYLPTIKLKSANYIEYDPTTVESFITSSASYTEDELTNNLLSKNNREFADKLWETQINKGLYTLSGSELDNRNISYFVSSSEGSDNNDGLSPDNPLKSLKALSGLSNTNILLKCGDVFKLDEAFTLGNNCIYAAYGEGNRPIVDFYIPFNLSLTKTAGYDNIWETTLSQIPSIIQEVKGKQNCNIGSLRINGKVNWKRLIEPWLETDTGEVDDEGNPIIIDKFNIPLMQNRADGCWGIDWYNDMFYIYAPDGENPNNWDIEYALVGTAFSTSCKNTIIKGIEFTGASGHAINATNSENLTIKCCYFHHIGGGFHKNSGLRYGNAIQIWDTGINILCKYNYCSDCFDTCYTSQGTTSGVHKENIEFSYNVGSQAFWILEDYGNIYDDTTVYKNVIYKHNVAYDARNISANDNPEEHYAREDGSDTPKEGFDNWYSYRNGYQFQQCCNIMAGGDSNTPNVGNEPVKFYDNIAWGTTRTLVKHGTDLLYEDWGATRDISIKGFRGNLLYNNFLEPKTYYHSYNVIKPPAIIRIDCKTSASDTKKKGKYFDSIFMFHDSNTLSQHYPEDDYDNSSEVAQLSFLIGQISGQRAETEDNYTEIFIEVNEDNMTVEKFIINGKEHLLVDISAVHDENYVHTSNNYTDDDKTKVNSSVSKQYVDNALSNYQINQDVIKVIIAQYLNDNNFIIEYTEDGSNKSMIATIAPINDGTVVLSYIAASKTVTQYEIGNDINTDDIVVTAYYSDGSMAVVTDNVSIDASAVNASDEGNYNIVVSYTENNITKTTQIPIDIVAIVIPELVSISATKTTVTYDIGAEVETNDIVVTALYDDGSTITVTDGLVVDASNVNVDEEGSYDISISYTDGGITKITTIQVIIVAKILSSIYVKKLNSTYEVNNNVDLSNVVVTATYDDDTTAVVTENVTVDDSNIITATAGEYNVPVTYTESGVKKTVNLPITIVDTLETNVEVDGSDSTGLIWKLYDTGELTLRGGLSSGIVVGDGTKTGQPWSNYMNDITKVKISGGQIKNINSYAFYNATNLTDVDFSANEFLFNGEHRVTLNKQAFSGCGFTTPTITNINQLGSSVFEKCNSLTEITLDAVTLTGNTTFYSSKNLTKVNLLNANSTAIGNNLFGNASSLTDIYVPWSEDNELSSNAPWGAPETATVHYNTVFD